MRTLIESTRPIVSHLSQHPYRFEILYGALAIVIGIVSLSIPFLFTQDDAVAEGSVEIVKNGEMKDINNNKEKYIYVDVSGAVNIPDVYKASMGTRLAEIIDMAGGINPNADEVFFARSFNLARVVYDEEKIYIPTYYEVQTEILNGNAPITLELQDNRKNPLKSQNMLVSVNTASKDELQTVPEITQIVAQKIINNRPYATLEELKSKNAVGKDRYEKIIDYIEL